MPVFILELEDFENPTTKEIKGNVNAWIKNEKLTYSFDPSSAQGKNQQLYNDFIRGLVVLGIDYKRPENQIDFDKFLSMLHTQLEQKDPEQYRMLEKHYSQGPLLFASAPFGPIIQNLEGYVVKQPSGDMMRQELFIENNEIYIRTSVQGYPVYHIDGNPQKPNFYLPGANFLFKLTENGFAFQKMETDSAFIRDVYLDEGSINKTRLEEEPDIANFLKACQNYANRLTAIKLDLQKELTSKEAEINQSIQILLEKQKAIKSLILILQDPQIKNDKLKYFQEAFNNVKDDLKKHRSAYGLKFNIHKSEGEKFVDLVESRLEQINKRKAPPIFGVRA